MTGERGRRVAKKVVVVLRKTHGRHRVSARRPALEELMLGVLVTDTSERKALRALGALTREFVDWNELRVSAPVDVAATMPDLPGALEKAQVLRAVLQRVYDLTNEMTLDFLKEKGPREAARVIADIEGFPENALARATVLALGHDVMPLTPGAVSVCRRLGLFADGLDAGGMVQEIQKLVPRAQMFEFHWLVSRHAATVCGSEAPLCDSCGLQGDCRTGRAHSKSPAAGRNGGKGGKGSRR